MNIDHAKDILSRNIKVLYGIFGIVESSGYFPTKTLLNQFFMQGNDPCDQDSRMGSWSPFELSESEYQKILEWWKSDHPGSKVDDFGTKYWADWTFEIIEME